MAQQKDMIRILTIGRLLHESAMLATDPGQVAKKLMQLARLYDRSIVLASYTGDIYKRGKTMDQAQVAQEKERIYQKAKKIAAEVGGGLCVKGGNVTWSIMINDWNLIELIYLLPKWRKVA